MERKQIMEKNKKKNIQKNYPVALTISASDSGGGSGIQADLRTFNAFGIYGCSVLTGVISSNPREVISTDHVAAETVSAQLEAVTSAVDVTWVKTGALFNENMIRAVVAAVKNNGLKLVCDPVVTSELPGETVKSLTEDLLPQAEWITPGIAEAEILLGRQISGDEAIRQAALELAEKFNASILLKGSQPDPQNSQGKLAKACDIVVRNGRSYKLTSFYAALPKYASHGAGCTLSAALTGCFALESPWKEALCVSKAFVLGSLIESVEIGNGIHAMYPPTGEYMNSVAIEEIC